MVRVEPPARHGPARHSPATRRDSPPASWQERGDGKQPKSAWRRYAKVHVIYDVNGVKITSFPAVHQYDGPVSFRLEWNGLTLVYSGDTTPSEFMIENGQGADVLIHEPFNTASQLMERSCYDERSARPIETVIPPHPA